MSALACKYQPLFPYFGGKARIAAAVWQAFGDVPNYVEPFFGSGAVLFSRPHPPKTETVNDADGLLANTWRSIKLSPDLVAQHADYPVSEADLHARHIWLVNHRQPITDQLIADPEWHDPKAAGWWLWGASQWIAGGWCTGTGPWNVHDGQLTNHATTGVWRQRPHHGDAGQGIHRKLPHLGDAGQGVHRPTTSVPNAATRKLAAHDLIHHFSTRLRHTRICCGNWDRILGPSVTTKHGITAVFLDPPYSTAANRDQDLYAIDCLNVANQAREWAIANAHNPSLRIALCGYASEHDMPPDWRTLHWSATGGYAKPSSKTTRNANKHAERIWFSPHCLGGSVQAQLFEMA